MKSAVFAVAGTLAAVASAQAIPELPACGQVCASNMLAPGKAEELGCSSGDIQCLCLNVNFTYGFRDCSLAVCSPEDAQSILSYGMDLCSRVGVQITTEASNGVPVPTRTGSVNAEDASIIQSTLYATVTSDGEAVTTPVETTIIGVGGIGGAASDAASSVVNIISTVTRDGSAVVETITSAVGGAISSGGAAISSGVSGIESGAASITSAVGSGVSDIASDASSAASEAGSAVSSVGSEISSAVGSASSLITSLIGSASDALETGTATSTESDDAAIPRMTAAPMGIIAAAGLAAFLL